jgi:hypothetical protein
MHSLRRSDPVERIRALGLTPERLVEEIYAGFEIRDRWYLFNRFPRCFVGSEATLWLMRQYSLAREAGLMLGNALIEMSVFHHVFDDWDFRDEYLFYRFYRDEKDRIAPPFTREQALDLLKTLGVGQLDALVAQMYQAVSIQDRRARLRLHRRSFVGREAADWLRRRFMLDRAQAIALGNALLSLRVFHHVLDTRHFEDSDSLYRFYDDEYRTEVLTPYQTYRRAWQTIQGYGIGDLDRFIAQCRASRSLGLKDRTYEGRRYPQTFAGFDAVTLWSNLLQITRPEAVALGNYLLDLGRLYHIGGLWNFQDAYLLYRFTSAEQLARVAMPATAEPAPASLGMAPTGWQ